MPRGLARASLIAVVLGCAATSTAAADRASVAGAALQESTAVPHPAAGGGTTDAPGAAPGGPAAGTERPLAAGTDQTIATTRSFPGFVPENLATEPLALLPATRVALPSALAEGPLGKDLLVELERIVRERLPAEVRILHDRAPVLAFFEWAGAEEAGPRSGFLQSLLAWNGSPGPAGELPEVVGNSVEELGDSRGVRFFLFPRALTIRQRDTFDYYATLEAFLLDARGERVVWAGTGIGAGTLPRDEVQELLRGVVRQAVLGAVTDLAVKLPGSRGTEGGRGFSDVQR